MGVSPGKVCSCSNREKQFWNCVGGICPALFSMTGFPPVPERWDKSSTFYLDESPALTGPILHSPFHPADLSTTVSDLQCRTRVKV